MGERQKGNNGLGTGTMGVSLFSTLEILLKTLHHKTAETNLHFKMLLHFFKNRFFNYGQQCKDNFVFNCMQS